VGRKKKKAAKKSRKKAKKKEPEQAPADPKPERVPRLSQNLEEPPKTPNEVLREELDSNRIVARGPDTPTLDRRAQFPEREPIRDPNDLLPQTPGPKPAVLSRDQVQRVRRKAILLRRKNRARENPRVPMTMMPKGQK